MRRFPWFIGLLLIAFGASTPLALAKPPSARSESLLDVISPSNRSIAEAHPWVNVRVRLGTASDGSAPDLTTFRVRFGKCDVTGLFEPVLSDGVVVEQRARLSSTKRCPFRGKKGFKNRLRFKIRTVGEGPQTKRLGSDADKVRFGVVTVENRTPILSLTVDTGALVPGVPLEFSAADTRDPDGDWLSFAWDFGDGAHATGPEVSHSYAIAQDVTVRLRVSDGQAEVDKARTLYAVPPLDAGRTPGTLRLSAPGAVPLEFGSVVVGGSATRVLTVHNDATDVPTSQLKFVLRVLDERSAFEHDCGSAVTPCELGPGEQREVTVTFAPQSGGHANATLIVIGSAANASQVGLLLHGYAGTGPGPWETSAAAFFLGEDRTVGVRQVDGIVKVLDVGTGTCEGGVIEGSACFTDADCPGGGQCGARVCLDGPAHGLPCAEPGDCPEEATCGWPIEPTDLCTDGSGSAFLFSDLAHDDADFDRDPAYSGWIVRVGTDGTRAVVSDQVAEDSTVVACDRQSTGRVYWAQYDLFGPDLEDEREQLKTVRKDGLGTVVLRVADVSARLGDVDPGSFIDPTDGYVFHEPSEALRVSADGSSSYVSNRHGLYRLEPAPLLITRDVTGRFDLFSDGTILAVGVLEDDAEVELRLFRLDANAAAGSALTLADLTPWATMAMPSNRGTCTHACLPSAIVTAAAVAPDGTVFVSVFTRGGAGVLPQNLRAAGVARFRPAPGGAGGEAAGFVSLETVSHLDF